MLSLILEPTNACNLNCRHCFVNKADAPEFIALELVAAILSQARSLGLKTVRLTGGEITVYPQLEDLLHLIAGQGFSFTLVTNGHRFQKRLMPLLSIPRLKKHLEGICFSLEGTRAEIHDNLRGAGSFAEVMKAASFCILKDIPFSLKTVLTGCNCTQAELTEVALLGASLGVRDHSFICTFPTPRLVREGLIPSPQEMLSISQWISGSLAKTVKGNIRVEGYLSDELPLVCCNAWSDLTVDYQGKQIICCNLSRLNIGDHTPTSFGEELLADLTETPLRYGMIRQFHVLAKIMEARLSEVEEPCGLNRYLCYWCMRRFGKLDWLKDYPESPWAAGVL
jgi:MoaA/NifB/PqqE/SkfB family radical SAM enzyme